MVDKAYLEKIQAMTDVELDRELNKVLEMQSDGYERMKGRDPFNLLMDASVKLCDDAIQAINEEQKKRRKEL